MFSARMGFEAYTPVSASGGTITTYTSGGITYKVHTFNTTGANSFVATGYGNLNARVLLVGGGGAGGGSAPAYSGGGGGGGQVIDTTLTISSGTYSLYIGEAGVGAIQTDGTNGN